MGVVKPEPFTTPDGKERQLRFTTGSRKRIADCFGTPDIRIILNQYDAGAVPGLLFACMFDEDGKPPPDLTEAKLAEQLPGDEAPDQLAAFLAAMSQGRQSRKELRAVIQAAVESELSIGSTIGALEPKASDSPTATSGGDSPKPNSTPESIAGSNSSDSTTAEPGPSLLPSAT